MPIYEYRCRKCGRTFEKIQKVADRTKGKCPDCGGAAERLASAPAIQFKGTGWYVTDYGRKGSGADKGEKGEKGEKGDKAHRDDKPAAKEEPGAKPGGKAKKKD